MGMGGTDIMILWELKGYGTPDDFFSFLISIQTPFLTFFSSQAGIALSISAPTYASSINV